MNDEPLNGGLSVNVIKSLKAVFKKFPAIERVNLFGSRAKGNYRNGSDIDLAIFSNSLAFDELIAIEGVIDDLMLPYTVDLVEVKSIVSEELLDHINRVGIIVYSQDEVS
ncbi:nucleotidyltransferase domain-containing protein [Psychrobium sp. nBUS_13]|jgi:predicted nucleotidyltransferase|uniref:nucleotidyltransferase domain-containing protein n=1 Tax=Psychrobium sp. nBUS_13 TaxID=3395319 RepID=UPI003EBCE963